MEAASIPAGPPASQRFKQLMGTYGLTIVLLILPVIFAIQDLQDEGDLSRLGENLVSGLSNGAIWALVAIGYTLVYGIVELINFAHGEVFMIGSFISVSFIADARPDDHFLRRTHLLRTARHARGGDGRLRDAQRPDREGGLPPPA